MKRLCILLALSFLIGCDASVEDAQRQEYIDKCIIAAGPQAGRYDAFSYCAAKWRQSQREK